MYAMRRLFAACAGGALLTLSLAGGVYAETTIRVAVPSGVNTLDPAKTKIGVEYNYNYMVFSGLTQFDNELNLLPDLAESWESSDDLKSWTFHLREDARFHDGRPVDAQDVIKTLERILDPETGSVLRVNFELIEKMKALDDKTVHFELAIPYSDFAALFSGYQARIVPRDHIDSLTTEPIGSGPFRFVEYLPGDRLVMAKNPEHWDADRIQVDRVEFRVIPEESAAIVAMEAGDIDIVWDLPPEEIDKLERRGTKLDEVATGTWWGLVMNNTRPPFDKLEVRQAFYALADKSLLTEIAALGHGTPTHSPIAPTHPFFADEIPIGTLDLERARALFEQAGVDPASLELELWAPAQTPELGRMAVAFRDAAKQLGIDVTVRPVPDDKFFGEVEGKETFHTTIFYDRVMLDAKLYPWFHSEGSWNANLWHFSDPEVDAVLEDARRARSDAERERLYKKLQRLIVEKVPGVIVYTSNHANGLRDRVKGFESSPLMLLNFRDVKVEP